MRWLALGSLQRREDHGGRASRKDHPVVQRDIQSTALPAIGGSIKKEWKLDGVNLTRPSMIAAAGVKSVKLPPRSPNLNAYAERFVRSIKESCLERLIFFGEDSLRAAIQNFVAHYHSERNHQGLANQLISPETGHLDKSGEVQRRQRLGGMLNYYYRAAA